MTWRYLAGRLEILMRGRLLSLRVKHVACQELILVGKWLPNDSFKPNPLRSCNAPYGLMSGSA